MEWSVLALLTVIYGMTLKCDGVLPHSMYGSWQRISAVADVDLHGRQRSDSGPQSRETMRLAIEGKSILISGIPDRFDSVIFTAPMIYFLAAIYCIVNRGILVWKNKPDSLFFNGYLFLSKTNSFDGKA